MTTARPLTVASAAEADWLNENVLHCGRVYPGHPWDDSISHPDPADRVLARRILNQYRDGHTAVSDDDRRQLAVCCRED